MPGKVYFSTTNAHTYKAAASVSIHTIHARTCTPLWSLISSISARSLSSLSPSLDAHPRGRASRRSESSPGRKSQTTHKGRRRQSSLSHLRRG